jgi:hypothetical protein
MMSWSLALLVEARCLYASRACKIGESVGCTRLVREQIYGKECADFMQEKSYLSSLIQENGWDRSIAILNSVLK